MEAEARSRKLRASVVDHTRQSEPRHPANSYEEGPVPPKGLPDAFGFSHALVSRRSQ